MFSWIKARKISGLVFVIIFFGLNSLFAFWGDNAGLPLPIGSQEEQVTQKSDTGSLFTMTFYSVMQDTGAVKDFYRRRMPQQGWQEIDPAGVPGLDQMRALMQDCVIFGKGNDLAAVIISPSTSNDGITHFAVGTNKAAAAAATDENTPPQLVAKDNEDLVPVYPRATLTASSKSGNSKQLTYQTSDSLEEVIDFYKEQMPGEGWVLGQEEPLQEVTFDNSDPDSLANLCPNCPQKINDIVGAMNSWGAALDFSRGKEQCTIGLSKVKSGEGAPMSFNMSTIVVNYEDAS